MSVPLPGFPGNGSVLLLLRTYRARRLAEPWRPLDWTRSRACRLPSGSERSTCSTVTSSRSSPSPGRALVHRNGLLPVQSKPSDISPATAAFARAGFRRASDGHWALGTGPIVSENVAARERVDSASPATGPVGFALRSLSATGALPAPLSPPPRMVSSGQRAAARPGALNRRGGGSVQPQRVGAVRQFRSFTTRLSPEGRSVMIMCSS